jgi:aryl-alcohol dehydrogenase-like predicted oxidoreductase
MDTVYLGKSGIAISALGFGTMSFGGDADEAMSGRLYGTCRDAGITLFDCADVYAGGRSEEILGKLIAPHRQDVVITSKGYFPTGKGANARGSTRLHLVDAVEASLKRLNTDRIDIYFLHRMDERTPMDQTLRAIEHLISQGKILYLGLSNFAAWQIVKAMGISALHDWSPLVAVQPMYNLIKRTAEAEILPMALSEGLGVLPYSPLAGGLLTGKYAGSLPDSKGRLVENKMYGIRYGVPTYQDSAAAFCAYAKEHGHHPVSLAIRWVASHPAVTAPLIGARNLIQLAPALESVNIPMSEATRTEISQLTPAPALATDRNEESSQHNYGSR